MSDGRNVSKAMLALALLSWAVCVLGTAFLRRFIGPSVAALNIVPVVTTGWLFGFRAGIVASLAVFPLSYLLLRLGGEASWSLLTSGGGLTGSVLLVLIGAGVGLLRDKVKEAKRELARRTKAEEALRKSEAALELQINRLPIGCIVWDSDFRVLSWNPAATAIFGFSQQEARGKRAYDLIVSESAQSDVDQIWRRLLEGDATASSENENITKDGRTITCSWTNTPLVEGSSVVGILSMVQDVTDRRRAEEQLSESENRIRQIQKMEAIGQLAGGVAHDFNNILMVILGLSELLMAKLPSDGSLHEHARTIKKAATKAGDLTHQLLAFSRRQMLQPRVVSLNEVVKDTQKMLRRLIREDIELVFALSSEAGQVKVDPGQVNQILMNLAANARDAMPHGGKLIIETCNIDLGSRAPMGHPELQPGRYVMLSVSDTGVGMEETTKSHLFEPFFTTKELGKGTGLGLATVYGIVKQSGGYIYAYSELGRGTAFKTYLPRIDSPPTDDEQVPWQAAESLRGTETILLVEDDVELRSLIRIILENNGYRVVEAENGREAVSKCREMETCVHGMVTDVVMPQMGGKEAVQQIKEMRGDLAVLFMSGYTEDFMKLNEMLEEGMAILQKPLRAEELLRQLRENLDRVKRRQITG